MIPALIIGKGGSRGVPGKNTMTILGRPLMTYSLMAARHSQHVGPVFIATDSASISAIGREYGAEILVLDPEMTRDTVLVESVVVHGYSEIVAKIGPIEMLLFMFCNSATMSPELIDSGIETLRADPSLDSAVSMSPYNEYSPIRAKKISAEGLVVPYVNVDRIPGASCDRDSAETCYFCDCSVWVLRPSCMDLDRGSLPFRWIGQRCAPIYQTGGLDIDHDYGMAMTEHWLRKHGFTESQTPYDSHQAPG